MDTRETREFTFSLEELLQVSSGYDTNHVAMSAGSFTLIRDGDRPEHSKAEKSLLLENAVFDFFVGPGCLAVQIDFPEDSLSIYDEMMKSLAEWFENRAEPDDLRYSAALVIVPMVLQAQFYLSLRNPTYYIGCITAKGGRIALMFPTSHLEGLEGDDIDYAALEREVEMELQKQEEALEKQIAQTQEEIDELKKKEAAAYMQISDMSAGNTALSILEEDEEEQTRKRQMNIRESNERAKRRKATEEEDEDE